jgi:hypothetical protein
VRPFLALLLFLPAFSILVALYLRRPLKARWSRQTDWLLIALSAGITAALTLWAYAQASAQDAGTLWPDVAAAVAAFHSFPFLLAIAWWARRASTKSNC